MATIDEVRNHPVMVEVLKDSFGGVMYNVDNRSKYEAAEVLSLWDEIPENEKQAAGGILTGAISFLQDAN